jgi:peptidoglycan/LPS O-acetylase OafA/YrhL
MDTIPRMTPLFYGEYIVQHQRWSPAFVGFAVAVALYGSCKRHEQRKKQTPATGLAATTLRVVYRVASFVLLVFSILLAALPVLMALSPPTEEVRTTVLANPPIEADFFVSVLGRTLNSCGWGYLLYRCLLPRGHVLRLNYLAAFFELPVFQFTGRHTYCIYMLHFLVLHFINFSVLSPPRMEALLGPMSADTLCTEFALRLAAGYAITFALSAVIVRFVEQPLLGVLQRESKRFEARVFGEAKKVV